MDYTNAKMFHVKWHTSMFGGDYAYVYITYGKSTDKLYVPEVEDEKDLYAELKFKYGHTFGLFYRDGKYYLPKV